MSGVSHNEYHRLGALSNRSVFSRSAGGQRSEIRVSAGCAPSEDSRGGSCHLFQLLGAPGVSWLVAESCGLLLHASL